MYDGEWRHLHNALCRAISGFASQAHVSNQLEGGKIAGTKKRPGDVRFAGDSGAHGWAKAGAKELWIDATVVCPLLPTYVAAASATRGAAAAAASTKKRSKYRDQIPGFALFLPMAFETEGFHCAELEQLLLGFAHKRASADGLEDSAAKAVARRWLECWLAQLAMVQARFTARCIYNRASACKDALSPAFRPASMVDVDLTLSSPPPPRATPYITAAARAAAAAAAAGLAR